MRLRAINTAIERISVRIALKRDRGMTEKSDRGKINDVINVKWTFIYAFIESKTFPVILKTWVIDMKYLDWLEALVY